MTSDELEKLFREWFADSYPNVKPATHSVMSHVAFAEHIIKVIKQDQDA